MWTLDSGLWTLDCGLWNMECGIWNVIVNAHMLWISYSLSLSFTLYLARLVRDRACLLACLVWSFFLSFLSHFPCLAFP